MSLVAVLNPTSSATSCSDLVTMADVQSGAIDEIPPPSVKSDGSRIYILGGYNGTAGGMVVWDTTTDTEAHFATDVTFVSGCMAISPDNHWLAIPNFNDTGQTQIYDTTTDAVVATLGAVGTHIDQSQCQFTPDSAYLLVLRNGVIQCWRVSDWSHMYDLTHPNTFSNFLVSPDGNWIARTTPGSGTSEIWISAFTASTGVGPQGPQFTFYIDNFCWLPDSSGIVFQHWVPSLSYLARLTTGTSGVVTDAATGYGMGLSNIFASPDGTKVVGCQPNGPDSQFLVITVSGWTQVAVACPTPGPGSAYWNQQRGAFITNNYYVCGAWNGAPTRLNLSGNSVDTIGHTGSAPLWPIASGTKTYFFDGLAQSAPTLTSVTPTSYDSFYGIVELVGTNLTGGGNLYLQSFKDGVPFGPTTVGIAASPTSPGAAFGYAVDDEHIIVNIAYPLVTAVQPEPLIPPAVYQIVASTQYGVGPSNPLDFTITAMHTVTLGRGWSEL